MLNHNEKEFQNWKSICLGIFFLFVFIILMFLSLLLVLIPGNSTSLSAQNGSKVFQFLSGGFFLFGILLIPAILLNFLKTAGINRPEIPIQMTDKYLLPVIISAWLLILGAGIFIETEIPSLSGIIPFFNIFTISLPILAILRLFFKNISLPEHRNIWNVVGFGIIFPPAIAIMLEFIVIGLLILVYILLASFSPGLSQVLESLAESIRSNTTSPAEMLPVIAKLVFAPGVTTIAFISFSILIPIIEELSKILLIIPLVKKISEPIHGFVFGAILGASFSLVENVGFSGSSTSDWGLNSLVRASAALPHIFNSGLLGFSLVKAYKNKSLWIALYAFFAVVVVHGSWNTISLGLALTDLSIYLAEVPSFLQYAYPWVTGWLILAAGVLVGMIRFNNEIQKLQHKSTVQPEV